MGLVEVCVSHRRKDSNKSPHETLKVSDWKVAVTNYERLNIQTQKWEVPVAHSLSVSCFRSQWLKKKLHEGCFEYRTVARKKAQQLGWGNITGFDRGAFIRRIRVDLNATLSVPEEIQNGGLGSFCHLTAAKPIRCTSYYPIRVP